MTVLTVVKRYWIEAEMSWQNIWSTENSNNHKIYGVPAGKKSRKT